MKCLHCKVGAFLFMEMFRELFHSEGSAVEESLIE